MKERSPQKTVKVLVVDRSPTARERLRAAFAEATDVELAGEAGTIDKAFRLLETVTPTTILVDSELPEPGAFAAVEAIMRLHPVPVIVLAKQAVTPALEARAMESGAVAVFSWHPYDSNGGAASLVELVKLVRTMSEVKVVRRRTQLLRQAVSSTQPETSKQSSPQSSVAASVPGPSTRISIVAIGASTGGPPVIRSILAALTKPIPTPVLVVQHLSSGFHRSLVNWLADATGLCVREGEHGLLLEPGIVYVAPDDRHMLVDSQGRLVLSDAPPENGSRPSVSVLFRSIAEHYGPRAIGILLTGMGRDGAWELRLMREKGAVTIAQDQESSVVHGMPGEAIKLKGARYILPPDRIPPVVEHHLFAHLGLDADAASGA